MAAGWVDMYCCFLRILTQRCVFFYWLCYHLANSVGSCTSVRDILFGMSFRISTYIRPMERWFLLSLVSPWDLCQDVMFCLSRYSRLSLQGSVFCTIIDGSWLGCAIISYCDGSSDFNSVLILNHCFPLHGFVFYHVFLVESYFCIFLFWHNQFFVCKGKFWKSLVVLV